VRWHESWRFDPRALPLADRHYNRQKPGTPQFVAPGRCAVFLTAEADALWVTSWPRFSQHAWAGAWINTHFRNESPHLSSALILEAVAATRARYGEPPAQGMVTFIDPKKVRHKRDPGRCYLRAGFVRVGVTRERGYLVLQLLPAAMPAAIEAGPRWAPALPLFAGVA
jgi:hypothetical protein